MEVLIQSVANLGFLLFCGIALIIFVETTHK